LERFGDRSLQAPEYKKEINMWKLALALLGFTIFAVLFSLGSTSGAAGDLILILFTAFTAIFIMGIAISIAPWLSDKSHETGNERHRIQHPLQAHLTSWLMENNDDRMAQDRGEVEAVQRSRNDQVPGQ
jgi:hypothetical protein